MRETKFRGKSIHTGEWLIGDLLHYAKTVCIAPLTGDWFDFVCSDRRISAVYEVHPDSVGQFTGQFDKNGNDIYEGAIVKSVSHDPENYSIAFIEGGFCMTHHSIKYFPIDINHFYLSIGTDLEIIGNIYENANLITP